MHAALAPDSFGNHVNGRVALAQAALGRGAVDPCELGTVRRELRLVAVAHMDGLAGEQFGEVDAPVRMVNQRAITHFAAQPLKIGRAALFASVCQRNNGYQEGSHEDQAGADAASCHLRFLVHALRRKAKTQQYRKRSVDRSGVEVHSA